ncbi:Shedu anti-phage system protein SduA domain-containing protein [Nocardia tengchongensis]|uniref:Shedu anti-phage system protein SduA domain-containing protein n=1 Tax=Nocardia tengchongensis TaxID=2055889 RepID=UPI0036493E78
MTTPDPNPDPTHLVADNDPGRPRALEWALYADRVAAAWVELLESDPEERAVQAFLERHPSMVPGGCGDIGPGGHHMSEMSAVFREPHLTGYGRKREPDFMWITRSTSLITPILIEIEKPSKRWFTKGDQPTAEFTQARNQLNDWRSWFSQPENQILFRKTYLFEDKYEDRALEPQFVLIYGRQSEFEIGGGHVRPEVLRRKRDLQRAADESFRTFDSLRPRYELGDSLTVTMTAQGPSVFAFSPVYHTSTGTYEDAFVLGDDISDAMNRTVWTTEERKGYLKSRWAHWYQVALNVRSGKLGSLIRDAGLE